MELERKKNYSFLRILRLCKSLVNFERKLERFQNKRFEIPNCEIVNEEWWLDKKFVKNLRRGHAQFCCCEIIFNSMIINILEKKRQIIVEFKKIRATTLQEYYWYCYLEKFQTFVIFYTGYQRLFHFRFSFFNNFKNIFKCNNLW